MVPPGRTVCSRFVEKRRTSTKHIRKTAICQIRQTRHKIRIKVKKFDRLIDRLDLRATERYKKKGRQRVNLTIVKKGERVGKRSGF